MTLKNLLEAKEKSHCPKTPPIKSLISHRNQAINLRSKSIDRFLSDMSLHRKGLLNGPECKNKILYKTRKYSFYVTFLRVHILR